MDQSIRYWKLGCKWKDVKCLYDPLREKEIVIFTLEKPKREAKMGDMVAISRTRGHKISAIAKITELPTPIIQGSSLEKDFEKYFHDAKTNYASDWKKANAIWYELPDNERFNYSTQHGNCEIKSPGTKENVARYKETLNRLFMDYQKQQAMKPYVELLKNNKNLILTGAPGTGKTYLAKELAREMIAKEEGKEGDQMAFVQFHPSYDYTDFVEGLRPVKKEGAELGFELKDGIFKAFCKKAVTEKDKNFAFIIDEINRAEISKVLGELFFAIDPGYRGEDGRIKTQYATLHEDGDIFKDGFYVPENVYIIGTMNDIDRSVESFDFAMRRRFAWQEVNATDRISMWDGNIDQWKEQAEKKMKALNQAIEEIEGLGIAFHIGPTYFLKLKDYDGDFGQLWHYHLKGLLSEYLRGMPEDKERLDELKKAYDL